MELKLRSILVLLFHLLKTTMHPLSGGRVLLTQTMVQLGNLVHTADQDCFVTLYLQKYIALEAEQVADITGEGTNSLRIAMDSSPDAIYIRNANCGTRPILENLPLKIGETLRISCTLPTRHILYGYSVTNTSV